MLDQSPTDDAGAVAYRRKSGYRPHRLVAQDTALSRRRHGFESRWGHASRNSAVERPCSCKATDGPVVKPGVHAALSRRRSRVRIPSGPQQRTAPAVARPGSSVGMSARLKSGRSTVRSCPWPPRTRQLTPGPPGSCGASESSQNQDSSSQNQLSSHLAAASLRSAPASVRSRGRASKRAFVCSASIDSALARTAIDSATRTASGGQPGRTASGGRRDHAGRPRLNRAAERSVGVNKPSASTNRRHHYTVGTEQTHGPDQNPGAASPRPVSAPRAGRRPNCCTRPRCGSALACAGRRLGIITPIIASGSPPHRSGDDPRRQWLEARVAITPLIRKHVALGKEMLPWMIGLFVIALLVWLWARTDSVALHGTSAASWSACWLLRFRLALFSKS